MDSLHSLDSAIACGAEQNYNNSSKNSENFRPNLDYYEKISSLFRKHVKELSWNDYKEWLQNNKSRCYANYIFSSGKKWNHYAFSNELVSLPPDRRREDILKAVTNLTRFIDITYDTYFHEDFLKWIKRKEIRWKSVKPFQIHKNIPLEPILKNIQKLPERWKLFGIFALVSGLRTFEIVKALNNHDALCHDGIIEMYWDRKTKKSNAVYCHPLLHDKIKYRYTENIVHRNLHSKKLGCQIRYLRKINYTQVATKIDPLLAEFMQGRRGNISQRHYFLPMMSQNKKKWIKLWNKVLVNF